MPYITQGLLNAKFLSVFVTTTIHMLEVLVTKSTLSWEGVDNVLAVKNNAAQKASNLGTVLIQCKLDLVKKHLSQKTQWIVLAAPRRAGISQLYADASKAKEKLDG